MAFTPTSDSNITGDRDDMFAKRNVLVPLLNARAVAQAQVDSLDAQIAAAAAALTVSANKLSTDALTFVPVAPY